MAAEELGRLELGRHVVAVQVVDQAEVHRALEQRPVDPRLLRGEDLHQRGRVGVAEGVDRRRQQRHRRRGHRPDPHRAGERAALVGGPLQRVGRLDHGEHVGEELAAVLAHRRPGAAPVEDLDPELPLQPPHVLAQRGLGEVQRLGGAAEGAEAGDGDGVFELLDSHGVSVPGDRLGRGGACEVISLKLTD